ncbi:SufE family protein [Shewanella donghaensis]|uniref:SufE family protein n=1 Tax=Shewanella donghaensis TaxID=238836 RepID=UPI001183DDA1|nr:SufE family protein [Shewanella donghaensis]
MNSPLIPLAAQVESQPEAQCFSPLDSKVAQAVDAIQTAKNWQDKYRQIMLVGKALPKLYDVFKQEHAQVKGCESQAWLYHKVIDGQHYFCADSDSRIVKGLIAILLHATHSKTTAEIKSFDLNMFFEQLGLSGQLSPSRTNGLTALANAIKQFAAN